MHAIIECLPVIFGALIGWVFQITKPFILKNILFSILLIISGLTANRISGEGLEWLFLDIAIACVSAFSVAIIYRYVFEKRR